MEQFKVIDNNEEDVLKFLERKALAFGLELTDEEIDKFCNYLKEGKIIAFDDGYYAGMIKRKGGEVCI